MPEQTSSMLPKARFPFRIKLTLLGALLAIVPLCALGLALIEVSRDTVKTMSRNLQFSIIEDLAKTIDAEFRESQNGLDTVGRILTDVTMDAEKTVALARHLISGNESLDNAMVYGTKGDVIEVFRSGESGLEAPEVLPETLRTTAAKEGVATGQVAAGVDFPRMLMVVPLRIEGTTTGYVASWVSLEPVQTRLERLVQRFENRESGVIVVDEDLRILAHPNRELVNTRPEVKQGIFRELDSALLSSSLAHLAKSTEFKDANGNEMIGTMVGLQSRPWTIVTQISQKVAYLSLTKMRQIVLGTLLIAMAIALLVAVILAQRITKPIQELSSFAHDLANRKWDGRVTLSTNDELSMLGDAMSAAAANLQESEHRIRKEEAIRGDLGRYLPANLVDKVVRREQDMGLGGRKQPVTVLFADVVAFTPMTDQLAPEEIVSLLNELFTILTEIVFRHGGTVDKFIGDCVMAIWGAPEPTQDHAVCALAAAEDMMRWLEAGNEGWKEKYGVTIELAIGVNTGEAIVGNIGSETRMQYTAIGDVVNVAARLEAIARPQQVLVTQSTYDAAGDMYDYVDRGIRSLTGREAAVHLYEVTV